MAEVVEWVEVVSARGKRGAPLGQRIRVEFRELDGDASMEATEAASQDGPMHSGSASAEVDGVVAGIRGLMSDGTSPREIAVLYRINARSSAFELALHREQIPFQVADGGFLERPAWRKVRTGLGASKESMDVTGVVDKVLDEAGYVPEIKETDVSP